MSAADDPSPLVSIVVIGYNQQDLAPIAINSVLVQTHRNLECIFIDDGSTDSTIDRVMALTRTDARLRAYRKENGGPGSARNYGAARISADSKFIAFLDGDDVFMPQFIEVTLRYLRENPTAGVVIPSHSFIDLSGAPLTGQRRGFRWAPSTFWLLPRRMRDFEHGTPFVTFYCGTGVVPFWLARIADYKNTDGWDEKLWMTEDVDMLCQLAMVTSVHTIAAQLVEYRIHVQQGTTKGGGASKRPPVGIDRVQEKWNQRRFDDERKNRELSSACIYYRQVHLPFRHLWVARRAFGEFMRSPSPASFTWLAKLLWFFLRDCLYFKIFFWRSTRHYNSAKERCQERRFTII